MDNAIVLLSGGQDSTTCLAWAEKQFNCTALTINYGQRHATELQAAKEIARHFEVEQVVIDLPVLSAIGGSALVGDDVALAADGGYGDAAAPGGLPTSFVPGRNLLFLGIAGALAVKRGAKHIVTGVCQTDYSGYPDCREEFVRQMARTLDAAMPSECGPFSIHTPLMHMTKAETVLMARDLPGAWRALALSVTCYNGVIVNGCGECPACVLRAKGFADANLPDPAKSRLQPLDF